jgi:UDP-N-acetylglucosamine diphosphorylase/glucosamine-1-phosphate N-acetyltransferase
MSFMVSICLYEDDGYRGLEPFTFLRPAYSLLLGAGTLYDKASDFFKFGNLTLHCRPLLKPYLRRLFPHHIINDINLGAPCLFVNGRLAMTQTIFDILNDSSKTNDMIFTHRGQVVALYLRDESLRRMKDILEAGTPSSQDLISEFRQTSAAKEMDDVALITYPWDLLVHQQQILSQDFDRFSLGGIVKGDMAPYSVIYNETQVYIGERCQIEDFALIDARKGPVILAEDVIVQSGSRLEGPLYIGPHSQILGGSIKSSSIGAHCKIGGEVSHSIIHDYSNKAHYGFLGHSIVGQWVNLGAGTTTSNLKNTYGTIKVTWSDHKLDTGLQFLGAILGDHVKASIGTLFSAGTRVGFGTTLLGNAIHDRDVPLFRWGQPSAYEPYPLEAFLTVANRMMSRRKLEMSPDEYELITSLFLSQ